VTSGEVIDRHREEDQARAIAEHIAQLARR
jgi:hypothetical protein